MGIVNRLLGIGAEPKPVDLGRRRFCQAGALGLGAAAVPASVATALAAEAPANVSIVRIFGSQVSAATGTPYAVLKANPAFRAAAIQVHNQCAPQIVAAGINTTVAEAATAQATRQITATVGTELAAGGQLFMVLDSGVKAGKLSSLPAAEIGKICQSSSAGFDIHGIRELIVESARDDRRVAKVIEKKAPDILLQREEPPELIQSRTMLENARAGISPIVRLPGSRDEWIHAIQKRIDSIQQRRRQEVSTERRDELVLVVRELRRDARTHTLQRVNNTIGEDRITLPQLMKLLDSVDNELQVKPTNKGKRNKPIVSRRDEARTAFGVPNNGAVIAEQVEPKPYTKAQVPREPASAKHQEI